MEYKIEKEIYRIKDLPTIDKPREKLKMLGAESLNNYELLAIILNNGSKAEDILTLSKRILSDYGQIEIMNYKDVLKMQHDLKLTFVKACQIIAVLELGKRLFGKEIENNIVLNTPEKVYEYVKDMHRLKKEIFRGLYLNVRNKLIHDEILTMGNTIENTIVPQIIFYPAINYYAQGIIIIHNHPSNEKSPSEDDIQTTKNIIEAGRILKIPVIDHIIIIKDDYYSFNENKLL